MSKPEIRDVVKDAFLDVHDGRSTDDVVIDDSLNARFREKCGELLPDVDEIDFNWCLLNLRKDSGLGPVVTKRQRDDHSDYLHASEIAARQAEDTSEKTIDRVLCDPKLRSEFDATASQLAPGVGKYLLRKAALKLRKGRQLQPELTKRVADWQVDVRKCAASDLQDDPSQIPAVPGVYLFYDQTGYLYIGEAGNLRLRVSKHLDHSDRKALARYLWDNGVADLWVELHAFDPLSNGRLVGPRRAYEASLIKSRHPRFNIKI
jgi:hypothetical protein